MGKEYFWASLVVFGLIRLFGFLAPSVSLAEFLAFNLAFALPIAVLAIYGAAVRRTRLAHTFADSGLVHGYLAHGFWRNVCLFLVSFLISFVLLINLALLRGLDWLWVGLAFLTFFLVRALIPSRLLKESVPWLRPARLNFWALALAPLLLGGGRFLFLMIFGSEATVDLPESPFSHSGSAFLKSVGAWAALFGTWGQKSWLLLRDFSRPIGFLVQVFNSFCLYGGFLAIIACLTLLKGEWRRGFAPPTESLNLPHFGFGQAAAYSAFLALFVLIVLIPGAGYLETFFAGPKGLVVEETRAKLAERGEGVFIFLEGKYYDPQAEAEAKKLAAALLSPILADQKALIAEANQLFNQYRANVDRYLDWYYSLKGEYSRLATLVKDGSAGAEAFLTAKMVELLGYEVDAQKFAVNLARLETKLAQYEGRLKELVAKSLSHFEVPAPLSARAQIRVLTFDKLVQNVTPVETFSFKNRLGLSAAAGISSGAIAGILAAKIGQKAIFKAAASALAKMAVSKGLTAGGGAALGAGIGSVVPGAGTAIGAGVGLIAGLVGGLVVEKVILNLEELVNRSEFKLTIINAIEAQRIATLRDLNFALVKDSSR
ncbi:MAG: hypothetical protein LBI10_02720 [Deltaproteobacteria bacterium]|nr:hypothetical protein [Deltaproteobacteria bacterium]